MKKLILLSIALLAFIASVPAAEITVFAAASLTDSLKQIATTYEKQSGDKISFNFGASSTLARQIEEGAPADIFFSADEAKMDGLEKKNLIAKTTRKSRLGNVLVVVVPAGSKLEIKSAGDLTNAAVEKIALADTKAVPAGVYAKAWLEQRQVWAGIESKVVPTENVRGALAAVESENVEAGVVYKTDASISKKIKVAYEVPAADAPKISYPMALVKESKQPASAKKFLDYLASEDAGQVFQRFGFILLNDR
ncbi:MAG TPA: molybdate ABC transporter substrate-binding protein [Candidatus Acidoferrales bacterium]|jgi:molybdate transport system substrate-binding protein|nr:molybdate ABC transporter substrate-binding protein [Candidatus Acidoferrales bacterium]